MAAIEKGRTEVRLEELLEKAIEKDVKLPSPVLVIRGTYRNSASYPADTTCEVLKGEADIISLYPPDAGEDCNKNYEIVFIIIPRTTDCVILVEDYGHDWHYRTIYAFDEKNMDWKVLEY